MRWIVALAIALPACGGPRPPTPQPIAREGSAAPPAAEPAPTVAECEALVAHAIELDATARADAPTDAERAQLLATLRPFVDECRALPRPHYRCAIAATSTAQLATCQRTPSSSTSNSSVAPGGMTPAAPRSP